MKHMIGVVQVLKGRISEPARASVAFALAEAVHASLPAHSLRWWATRGRGRFLTECDVGDPATTRDDLSIEATDLAEFINRWRAVKKWRRGDEWVDLTDEMKALIATMTEDLEALS